MIEHNKDDKIIVDSFQIDEDGMKVIQTIDVPLLMKSGIVDVAAFINGLLDAQNENEFKESSTDYVKGYKYGKTGEF